MTGEINPSELGAYTNNLPNKEGLKKLCEKVNQGGSGGVEYTAGENIQISAENVISATDTKYTAGTNVEISEQNVISATDTKYTAGTGISISEQNVISATGGSSWSKRTNNNDWTDLFEFGAAEVTAKKNIIFFDTTNKATVIIMKGESANSIEKRTPCTPFVEDNTKFFFCAYYRITVSQSTSSYITCNYLGYTYNNSNNTFTTVTSTNQASKNSMTIYVSD